MATLSQRAMSSTPGSAPCIPQPTRPWPSCLLDVVGARAYHSGQTSDAGTVGVRALDDYTLFVELEEPVGHFLAPARGGGDLSPAQARYRGLWRGLVQA